MKAVLIHGIYGNPNENWFPWLKEKLEENGVKVLVPKFPTPENQNLDNWMKVFDSDSEFVDEETIFIAHSLGPAFVLSILEKMNHKIKGCFFVSGFIGGPIGIPEIDELNKSFTQKDFDFSKIKSNCKFFKTYCSDNDPYIPLKKLKEFSFKLDKELEIIPGAGHLNEVAGYLKFEKLLRDILDLKC